MSGPYDHPISIVPPDRYDPAYGTVDAHYGSYAAVAGPPTPFDGVGFWYRPDVQESVYHQDTGRVSGGMQIQATQPDQQAGIKHRRTRSGCFTCRSRRVKCDETRPICDRCRKGNRECEFPKITASSKRGKAGDSKPGTNESTTRDTKVGVRLDTIEDESDADEDEEDDYADDQDAPPSASSRSRPNLMNVRTQSTHSIEDQIRSRQHSDASFFAYERSNSLTNDEPLSTTPISLTAMSSRDFSRIADAIENSRSLKPEQKKEVTAYLKFQQEHMTYCHYFFKIDPNDFLHGELIDLALKFEPLFYAVVGFAAYHHAIQLPSEDADFNSFWKYYCKSIVKLRQWLETHQERDDTVMLTVLQLATFEEYMGDWTNLVSHQRAAHNILTTIYTPESIMNTERSRRIFEWYSRLDVISGLMAVRDTMLDRAWFASSEIWHEAHSKSADADIGDVLTYFTACIRLVGFDMAHLFGSVNTAEAQFDQGEDPDLSMAELLGQVNKLDDRMDDIRKEIQQVHNRRFTARDTAPALANEEEPFDPHIPLFRDVLWPLNIIWTDWYGVVQMLKYHGFLAECKARRIDQAKTGAADEVLKEPPLNELQQLSQVQCQILEAIERSPSAPPGAILGCQGSLGLSAVFLPKPPPEENNKFMMWARRKLANMERQGYVWPPQFRRSMAEHWNVDELNDWWLPNGEGKLKLLDEIRAIVEDRNRATIEHLERTGKDDGRTDLREIRGLFENLSLSQQRDSPRSVSMAQRLDTNYMASMVSSPSDAESNSGSFIEIGLRGGDQLGRKGEGTRRRSRGSSFVGTNAARSAGPPSTGQPTQPAERMTGIWEERS